MKYLFIKVFSKTTMPFLIMLIFLLVIGALILSSLSALGRLDSEVRGVSTKLSMADSLLDAESERLQGLFQDRLDSLIPGQPFNPSQFLTDEFTSVLAVNADGGILAQAGRDLGLRESIIGTSVEALLHQPELTETLRSL